MRTIKYNVKTFDSDGNIVDDDEYTTLSDIQRAYPQLTYNLVYYIANHQNITKKPSKKMTKLAERFQITSYDDNAWEDIFTKANL